MVVAIQVGRVGVILFGGRGKGVWYYCSPRKTLHVASFEARKNVIFDKLISENDDNVGNLSKHKKEDLPLLWTMRLQRNNVSRNRSRKCCYVRGYLNLKPQNPDNIFLPVDTVPTGRSPDQIRSPVYVSATRAVSKIVSTPTSKTWKVSIRNGIGESFSIVLWIIRRRTFFKGGSSDRGSYGI